MTSLMGLRRYSTTWDRGSRGRERGGWRYCRRVTRGGCRGGVTGVETAVRFGPTRLVREEREKGRRAEGRVRAVYVGPLVPTLHRAHACECMVRGCVVHLAVAVVPCHHERGFIAIVSDMEVSVARDKKPHLCTKETDRGTGGRERELGSETQPHPNNQRKKERKERKKKQTSPDSFVRPGGVPCGWLS